MRGIHHVLIDTKRIRYEFDIKRNITVIMGDSATGKTTLLELLEQYSRRDKQSGILLQSDVPCVVYMGDEKYWRIFFRSIEGSIVFIDEDYSFVYSDEFAEVIKESDNYYVFITRKPLKNLPYSINEIYGIRTSGKYHFPEKIYNEFYPIYRLEQQSDSQSEHNVILVEDSNSGFQFYNQSCLETRVMSAAGNSNIIRYLEQWNEKDDIIVIADGAAFGAYIDLVYKIYEKRRKIVLFFPESFEWMILKSGILDNSEIRRILAAPEDYIDSKEYFSWERFFTSTLIEQSKDIYYLRYQKDKLPGFYLEENSKEKILAVMPEMIKDRIR